jgi:hypothetical protein
MTVAPQAETEIVNGIIQGIVAKGQDKWQVEVNVGQQNPRRLWTKDAALVGQLSMMIGQQTSFLCGISHWTNNSGQQVRSLWINGVGAGGQPAQMPQQPVMQQQPIMQQQPQQQAWQQPQLPQQQPTVVTPQAVPMGPVAQMSAPRSDWIPEPEREKRIHRQTATKVASILISHVPAEQRTVDNVLALSERLVAYYENGLAQATMDGGSGPDYPGDPGPQGVPHSDGDFPAGY